jgi:hypothetical protein
MNLKKIIFIILLVSSRIGFSQVDRIFIQCEIENKLTNFYFEGPNLDEYVAQINVEEIHIGNYPCTFKMWLIENSNSIAFARNCGFTELKLENYLDYLTQINIRTERVEGYEHALELYDSLNEANQKFMISPSILTEKKYELNFSAYFTDSVDNDLFYATIQKIKTNYAYIDSVDFLSIKLGFDHVMFTVFISEPEFDFKPIEDAGLYFKEVPKVALRTYGFTMFHEKEE